MDLPTFIVILFLANGTVYTHTEQAPSLQACVSSLPKVQQMLRTTVKEPIELYSATCMNMRPFAKSDA